MFIVDCDCGAKLETTAAKLDQPLRCLDCGRENFCITAETLDDASASADFDAALLIAAGPSREAERIALGGCVTLLVGSGNSSHIVLSGDGVAEMHFKLVRLDFGPSRWQIEAVDGNAVLINGKKIATQELEPGDTLQVGDYEILYQAARATTGPMPEDEPVTAQVKQAPPRVETSGPLCPSCQRRLGHHAKICVDCGIHVPSGRPLITSEALDENIVHGNAETAIKLVSFLVWVTPLPIPLASSAYGKFKPYAIWMIAALTVLLSIWFLTANLGLDPQEPSATRNLMLWPLHPNYEAIIDQQMHILERDQETGPRLRNLRSNEYYSDSEIRRQFEKHAHEFEFHTYQLITHAFLHDPSSIFGFILHLGGNLLFLIVFGSRVNALIGNTATAIVYPVLAIMAGLASVLMAPTDELAPMIGASGAINGLAGMYLVLLPAHIVYCAMWCRLSLRYMGMKVFALRGFWILLIYFAYDLLMTWIGGDAHTAHWAHIGGFVTGFVIGIAMLISRKFNCRNGDLLSMLLGKHAWPLIGKPIREMKNEE